MVVRARRLLTAVICCGIASTSQGAFGGVILSSSFDSVTGTAINGVSGGTGTLVAPSPHTSIVTNANPLSSLGGGYLEASAFGGGGNVSLGATMTPATAANSWAALASKVSGTWQINGGFDALIRHNGGKTAGLGYDNSQGGGELELIDFGSSTNTSQIRLHMGNFSTTGHWGIRLIGIDGSLSNGTTDGLVDDLTLAPTSFTITANTTYHVGVTFNTDVSGVTTVRVFAKQGDGAIDTTLTTDLLGSATFDMAETQTGVFSSGAFAVGIRNTLDHSNKTLAVDQVRLYEADPGLFTAIPEPAAGLLSFGLGTLVLAQRRRCQRKGDVLLGGNRF